MNLTISDFYRICKSSVRLFPATSPVNTCKQLQTFRVLQRDPRQNAEVGTETFGAVPTDKDSPFFWSRKWELNKYKIDKLSYEYPAFVAFEIVNETNGDIFTGKASRTYTVELSVLDVFKPESCKTFTSNQCEGRTINQIFLDTELLLDSALGYIGGTVIATTTADPVQKIYNKQILQSLYPNDHNIVIDLGTIWKSRNQKMIFSRVEYAVKNIYGTKTRFVFVADNCQSITFNNSIEDLGTIGFEAGCTNC